MKLKSTIYTLATVIMATSLAGCDERKDLIIIEGNLPIKTSTLYMVGDATPGGWSIDAPTPLQVSESDPLLFTWEGCLNTGELKLCLNTGSWDAPFIRPMENGAEIGRADINDAAFQMHAGDPDEKWRITEAGIYSLSFNLRDWTMSTRYVGEPEAPTIEPIETDALYIVGDATPGGWNIDTPTALTKTADYTFEYDGPLTAGDFKACLSTGSWDVSFIRPASDGVIINKEGVQTPEFIFSTNPDNKWKVADAGLYHIVFDLRNWTISATFNGELEPDLEPIESNTLFMIGDATPGGWSMDDATAFTQSTDNRYIFTWEGELVTGSMKACLEPDGTFSCPFLRPSSAGVTISSAGVAAPDFVFTTGPDDQWAITEAGRYRITFNLKEWTITATKL